MPGHDLVKRGCPPSSPNALPRCSTLFALLTSWRSPSSPSGSTRNVTPGGRRALLRAVRPLGVDLGLTSVSNLERGTGGTRWPTGTARRPVRLAARDHPGRTAGKRNGTERAGQDRRLGAAERLETGQARAALQAVGQVGSWIWRRCPWCPGSCAGCPGDGGRGLGAVVGGVPGDPVPRRGATALGRPGRLPARQPCPCGDLLEEARVELVFHRATERAPAGGRTGCWWPACRWTTRCRSVPGAGAAGQHVDRPGTAASFLIHYAMHTGPEEDDPVRSPRAP